MYEFTKLKKKSKMAPKIAFLAVFGHFLVFIALNLTGRVNLTDFHG